MAKSPATTPKKDGYLTLSRKLQERIIIGDDPILENNIIILYSNIKGNRVFLGIRAPAHLAINREEVYNQIMEQRKIEEVNSATIQV